MTLLRGDIISLTGPPKFPGQKQSYQIWLCTCPYLCRGFPQCLDWGVVFFQITKYFPFEYGNDTEFGNLKMVITGPWWFCQVDGESFAPEGLPVQPGKPGEGEALANPWKGTSKRICSFPFLRKLLVFSKTPFYLRYSQTKAL